MLKCTFSELEHMIDIDKIPLYCFGKSLILDEFIDRYPSFKISGIIDNNPHLWGLRYCRGDKRIPIISLNELKEKLIIILITSKHMREMSLQCELEGFLQVYSYFETVDLSKIERLKNLLYDEKSKTIVDKIMQKRRVGNKDYSDIFEEHQYFVKDIIKLNNHEVFLDCGGYIGDTIEDFLKNANNKFDKIYSFEPIPENYNKLDITYSKDKRIICINKGVSDRDDKLNFINNGSGSRIITEYKENDNYNYVDVVTVDSLRLDCVTYIKMDVEGWEMNALRGAVNTIKRCHPKLAICLYHKGEDIFDIPFWIEDLKLDYKFFIRHHSNVFHETVFYAV